ncbi:MAG TPA: DUF2461 domain-containing protein [Rhizomicrobium sp.]|jgi:uncharacterized protein (TIGR02453 family)|nr:DUF2461 domain-containing protein [Rhizomicrobium sp.]
MAETFQGFPKDFFAFFRELKASNNRPWFEANKPRFKDSVQAPMSDFIAAMQPRLAKISKNFVADPRPNGGSMFRIYRDVRFSKDKRPYKEHAACHFHHAGGRDVHAPGFYMHFGDDAVYFGGGMYLPDPPALGRIRDAIVARPAAWKALKADKVFVKTFASLGGDHALTRAPRGYDPAHPLIEDIKRKSFFAMAPADVRLAASPLLADAVAATFGAAVPLMKFLCAAQGVAF